MAVPKKRISYLRKHRKYQKKINFIKNLRENTNVTTTTAKRWIKIYNSIINFI